MARKIYKVRAIVADKRGRVYAIEGKASHVLQLVGGSRKASEKPSKAILREVLEETGFEVKITHRLGRSEVKRGGVREITTFYVVKIVGGNGKAKLTGREARRGLHSVRYAGPKSLLTALQNKSARYGRSAVRRDERLVRGSLAS